jgi:hypothetical protein
MAGAVNAAVERLCSCRNAVEKDKKRVREVIDSAWATKVAP